VATCGNGVHAAAKAGGGSEGEGGVMGWSDEARGIVAKVLAALPADTDVKAARRALRDAYPWGPREYWPYKAWCAAAKPALAVRFPPPAAPPCSACGGLGWVALPDGAGSASCRLCLPRSGGGK